MLVTRISYFLLATVIFTSLAQAQESSTPLNHRAPATIAQNQLAQLESSSGGRLGVMAINTANNQQIEYRANERFPFGSTSKVMVVAAALKHSQTNPKFLSQNISYTAKKAKDSGYAPITSKHVSGGMSINALAEAAIEYSDNGAANLLIAKLGGVAAINRYAHSINDTVYHQDRIEPELNSALPQDSRDTTTPAAMALSLENLLLGNALDLPQRTQLQQWLKANTTGNKRIRAGVPLGWVVGDKTGTSSYGTTNDIGIIWPTKCQPLVIAVYYTQAQADSAPKDEVIAEATKIVLAGFASNSPCIKARMK